MSVRARRPGVGLARLPRGCSRATPRMRAERLGSLRDSAGGGAWLLSRRRRSSRISEGARSYRRRDRGRRRPARRASREAARTMCAIRLASEGHLAGRLIGVLPSGDAVELGDVAVAPGSMARAAAVVMPQRIPDRISIRSNACCSGQAPKPPGPRRPTRCDAAGALIWLPVRSAAARPTASQRYSTDRTARMQRDADAVRSAWVWYAPVPHALRWRRLRMGGLEAANGEIAIALPAGPQSTCRSRWQHEIGRAPRPHLVSVSAPRRDIAARVSLRRAIPQPARRPCSPRTSRSPGSRPSRARRARCGDASAPVARRHQPAAGRRLPRDRPLARASIDAAQRKRFFDVALLPAHRMRPDGYRALVLKLTRSLGTVPRCKEATE